MSDTAPDDTAPDDTAPDYTVLPDTVPASAVVEVVADTAFPQVPLGPEGGGDD